MNRFFIILTVFLTFQAKAQTTYFPPTTGSAWDSTSIASLGWCSDKVDTLYDYLEAQNSKAFILLKDGKIVFEKYFGTFEQDSLWYWASAGKTLTSFMVGIAQQEGHLSIDDTSSHYMGAGWSNLTPTQEEKITIWHQLTMTTGLEDDVPDHYCTDDTCLIHLVDPGTRWAYHNGPYTLLDSVMEVATGQSLNLYTTLKLKNPTGMSGFFYPIGYNNVFLSTPRSMARFGLLISNDGTWDGSQIMTDQTYFNEMVNTSQSINQSYGYLWWLNGKASFRLPSTQVQFSGSIMPNAPSDVIAALGKNGQLINVSKSNGLVLVRMGNAPTSSEVPALMNDEIWVLLNDIMCVPTGLKDEYENLVSIYPNPSSEQFHVNLPFEGEMKVMNSTGQLIATYYSSEENIDLSNSPSGTYYLKINIGGTIITRKLVKQ